jgi:hypothetical protein
MLMRHLSSALQHLLLGVLLSVSTGRGSIVAPASNTCLQNLVVHKASSTKAQLSWEFTCERADLQLYKVHYSHLRYLSCPDGRKDTSRPSGFGTAEVKTEVVQLEDLHPHSEYSVEVRAILRPPRGEKPGGRPESLKTVLSTEYSLPKVRPAESSLDYTYRWTHSKLVFNWSPPLAASLCDNFNADLGYYFYRLRGTSPWNLDYEKVDNLTLSETILTVTDLLPYSEYVLMVYVTNTAGEYDLDVYMRLEGRTLAAPPHEPRDLRLLPSSHQGALHLHWKSPYPPTGKFLRW